MIIVQLLAAYSHVFRKLFFGENSQQARTNSQALLATTNAQQISNPSTAARIDLSAVNNLLDPFKTQREQRRLLHDLQYIQANDLLEIENVLNPFKSSREVFCATASVSRMER